MKRLPPVAGELIDRTRAVAFSFEGASYQGYAGDTVSSALAANGLRLIGRSFKYHRPRGLLSAANHDANAIVQVREDGRSLPNVRADVATVQPGWRMSAVNTLGGLARDRLAVLERFAAFLPVGFYYKAFGSKRLFPYWERMFRWLTGLGTVDLTAPRRVSPKRYDFCDVLVVGAGPAGLAAASAASARGASVLLVDENAAPGGSGCYARGGSSSTFDRCTALIAEIQRNPRIRLMLDACAVGYYADHWVALATPAYLVKVRARSVIITQGAFEQPAVFRGNDLPGVMLASAGQRMLYRYAVGTATQLAVLTSNAEGYAAALDAAAHGIAVRVLDLRTELGPASERQAQELVARGVTTYRGVRPIEACGSGGLASFLFQHEISGQAREERLALDGLWVSVGFAPANGLLHQAGARFRYESSVEQFVPAELPAGVYAAGKVNGVYGFEGRLEDGRYAGECARAYLAGRERPGAPPVQPAAESPTHAYPIFPHRRGKEFVDFDEDLQLRDFENACQEGFDSAELLKRYSTFGMGPSQGKHSNMNVLRILAAQLQVPIGSLAPPTARPMFHPVPMADLAGRGFTPERRTPLDGEHVALGTVWMPAGNWRRPEYYVRSGTSRETAIAEETEAVRRAVGLIDVGTLGKVEAHGPQAAEFLERAYCGRYANLKVGMTRYGLMLDETGIVIDDGVIGRLAPESFYFTTTTGNSATLFREFGRLATWWGMSVGLVNLTGHYAAFNLAGPRSREVLGSLTSLELDAAAFPYLGIRETVVAGAPCRILRVGFVGELGYEIHLPAEHAVSVWRALLAAGAPHGIRPFGVEAQRLLRLEKGHIIVGQDTDGVTHALEIDMPWAVKMDKPFFVGQRSLRVHETRPLRQRLIGFRLPVGTPRRPREGSLFIEEGRIAGRVTSVGLSPTLGRCIGLALVEPALVGRKTLSIRIAPGMQVEVEVVKPPFYDPEGHRQHGGGES
ncbi:MAG TPA: 2Fe-2S iron-sulfur cluster-binding protein [Steroidobacteraceae bacterium]|nr:2Fe-2S iron-sulfur cluster-binding protein [Steroidobacteraceae bacterium]